MRHLTAAQKGAGGGWHYVSMSRDGGHPLGYCCEHEPHATEEDARACYGQWLRDHVAEAGTWSWGGCDVRGDDGNCPNPSRNGWATPGQHHLVILCDEHNDKEHAIAAMHLDSPAGDMWIS